MHTISHEVRAARILVADDQSAEVHVLTCALQEAGYSRVESTLHGCKVPELHAANRYDAILLDLQMHDMDGLAVLNALKATSPSAFLPVLVLTTEKSQKRKAIEAGAKDFVSKPLDAIEVKTRIQNMLELHMLYRRVEAYSGNLENLVRERTKALAASEARYRSLTELASDWYWEQDEMGNLIQGTGPAIDLFSHGDSPAPAAGRAPNANGWNPAERESIRETIAARRPFLDREFIRLKPDGTPSCYRVSGEPIFDTSKRYVGYRGIGAEVIGKP